MKKGWEYKELGELCHKFNGLWKGKKAPFVRVGVIRNANFTKAFTLDFSNIEYLDVEEKQYASRKLQLGDLIVEKSGGSEKQPVGRAVLFQEKEGEYSFSNFTSVLRVKDNHEITPEFLYKYILHVYLRGDTRKMQKATTGIHNIEFDKYLAIKIPIPPLSEQKEIVEYLDSSFAKIDKLKENAAKNLEEAKALFQSALKDALEPKEGWEEKTIQNVCEILNGFAFPSASFMNKGCLKVIKITNVGVGEFIEDNSRLSIEHQDNSAKVNENDIVIALTRTIIADGLKKARVPFSYDGALLNQRVAALTPKKNVVENSFVYYYLGTAQVSKYVLSKVNTLMQPNLSIGDLKKMPIPLPSLQEQQSIVSFLDSLNEKVNTLQQNYSRICDECDALKQAILRQVFE